MCLFNLCSLLRVKFNLVGRFTQPDISGALGSTGESFHPARRLINAMRKDLQDDKRWEPDEQKQNNQLLEKA